MPPLHSEMWRGRPPLYLFLHKGHCKGPSANVNIVYIEGSQIHTFLLTRDVFCSRLPSDCPFDFICSDRPCDAFCSVLLNDSFNLVEDDH
eukprot:1137946-Amorphochlora_amoeboformis.AAC.1